MSDGRKEREVLAARILADARTRAATVINNGVRANMMRAAERKAERALAGLPVGPASCWPVAAGPASGRATMVSRDLRDTDGAPKPTVRRSCLQCRRDFDSHGPGNRMCEPCRARSADASPYAV